MFGIHVSSIANFHSMISRIGRHAQLPYQCVQYYVPTVCILQKVVTLLTLFSFRVIIITLYIIIVYLSIVHQITSTTLLNIHVPNKVLRDDILEVHLLRYVAVLPRYAVSLYKVLSIISRPISIQIKQSVTRMKSNHC